MSAPLISILRRTRDRANRLSQSLSTVVAGAEACILPCEVAVVDNVSTDLTLKVPAECPTDHLIRRVVTDPRPSKARALNRALPNLRDRVTLFTDDDIQGFRSWMDDIAASILSGETDARASRVLPAAHLGRPWLTGGSRSALAEFETGEAEHHESGIIGANMAVATSVARQICFDEALGPGPPGFSDDIRFNLRLKATGFRAKGVQAEPTEHPPVPSRVLRDTILNLVRRNGESHAYFWPPWIHFSPPLLRVRLLLATIRLVLERHPQGIPEPGQSKDNVTYRVALLEELREEKRLAPRLSLTPRTAVVAHVLVSDAPSAG